MTLTRARLDRTSECARNAVVAMGGSLRSAYQQAIPNDGSEHMIRSVGRMALLASITAVGTVAAIATPAVADNWYGASGYIGCQNGTMADNWEHTYYYSSLTSAMSAATTWSRTNNVDPTNMQSVLLSTPTATTDVVVYDEDYTNFCGYTWNGSGGTVVGLVSCVSLTTANTCEKHEMRFDTSFTGSTSQATQRVLACHETGHTIGLTHRSGSCIATPLTSTNTYSGHDIGHIDGI